MNLRKPRWDHSKRTLYASAYWLRTLAARPWNTVIDLSCPLFDRTWS